MIRIEWHRLFFRYYQKLSAKQKAVLKERILLFEKDARHPLLRVHRLTGDASNFYSFSIGGDLRVIFEWPVKDRVIFHKVGTHNQVY